MERDAAARIAAALIQRAPGAARNDPRRLEDRVAQLTGVLHDLVPGGDAWRLMSPHDPPPGLDVSSLHWLAVLDEDALCSVSMVEGQDKYATLQVRVVRVPFDLIEVSSVIDARVNDHGAIRIQRSWQFLIGNRAVMLEEDRMLGARLDSEDSFTHELARRAGWPVATDIVDS